MSDDNAPFKAKQSEHAQKIRAERAVMDMTGASRSQIRDITRSMTAFQQRTLPGAPPAQAKPEPPNAKIESTTVAFPPSKLSLETGVKSNPSGGPGNGGGGDVIEDIIIVFNGTAYYCTLNGVVGDPV